VGYQGADETGGAPPLDRAKIQQKYRKRQKDKTEELQATVQDLRGHLTMLEQQVHSSAVQGAAMPSGMMAVVHAPLRPFLPPHSPAKPAELPAPARSELTAVSTEAARLRHLIAQLTDDDATKEEEEPADAAKVADTGLLSAFMLPESDMKKLKECVLRPPPVTLKRCTHATN
jgi:hypothetical protein